MRAYVIQATRQRETAHGTLTMQVPTFYLLANVQGIVSEAHAARVAADVIGPDVVPDSIVAVAVTIGDDFQDDGGEGCEASEDGHHRISDSLCSDCLEYI